MNNNLLSKNKMAKFVDSINMYKKSVGIEEFSDNPELPKTDEDIMKVSKMTTNWLIDKGLAPNIKDKAALTMEIYNNAKELFDRYVDTESGKNMFKMFLPVAIELFKKE